MLKFRATLYIYFATNEHAALNFKTVDILLQIAFLCILYTRKFLKYT